MEQLREGTLIYVGVDEAGYGPRLGPLCVAFSIFEVAGWRPGAGAPDLWKALSRAICRDLKDTRSGLIAVNDSKRLRLAPKPDARADDARHITHLERGVLAFLASAGVTPQSDQQLLDALTGPPRSSLPWYACDPQPLPRTTTADHLTLMAGGLARACEGAGVRLLKARCRAMDEALFNQRVTRTGNKASVSFAVIAGILRRVWENYAARPDLADGGPRIVVDRQGGRMRYADALTRAVPGAQVRTIEETPLHSRYELVAGDRRMSVLFLVEAESEHLPVALASMIAKLTRETLMLRFNRYWSARIRELKPTAGYATDAGRWLRDAGPHLTPAERGALVRIA